MRYSLALTYFVVFLALFRCVDKAGAKTTLYGICMFILLCLTSILNFELDLIAEKVASFVSYEMATGGQFVSTFFIQYILTVLPTQLFDFQYSAHALSIAVQAFAFFLSAKYIFGIKRSWQLIVLTIFPSYFHYSIFGLRDPLINISTTLLVIFALKLSIRKFFVLSATLALVNIGIRPEFSLIIAGFLGLRLYFQATKYYKVLIVLIAIASLYAALLLMPYAFGFQGTGSVTDNINAVIRFNEMRSTRHLDAIGSGSHILGGQLAYWPFVIKYPIQVLASFLTPLPIDIRGGLDIAAFCESLLFICVAIIAFRASLVNKTARYLFYCGIIYMMLQAVFAFNYGNLLRVRYPCFIFFLAATTFLNKRDRRKSPST